MHCSVDYNALSDILKVNNNYNLTTNKMHELFDECVPLVILVELYASGKHLPLCLCCPDRFVAPGCALPFSKG